MLEGDQKQVSQKIWINHVSQIWETKRKSNKAVTELYWGTISGQMFGLCHLLASKIFYRIFGVEGQDLQSQIFSIIFFKNAFVTNIFGRLQCFPWNDEWNKNFLEF